MATRYRRALHDAAGARYMRDKELYRCRVCGFEEPVPPWGEDGATPTFDFCDCCGVEFGYADSSLAGIRRYRERWLAEGAKWHSPQYKPEGWMLEEQLQHIPIQFR
jgi:hypothetical protein